MREESAQLIVSELNERAPEAIKAASEATLDLPVELPAIVGSQLKLLAT
jgi:hypothetical protein